jgi:hypothetical protein
MMDLFENNNDLIAIEGMDVWLEVQYLTSIGLKERAEEYVCNRLMQNNKYSKALGSILKNSRSAIRKKCIPIPRSNASAICSAKSKTPSKTYRQSDSVLSAC